MPKSHAEGDEPFSLRGGKLVMFIEYSSGSAEEAFG